MDKDIYDLFRHEETEEIEKELEKCRKLWIPSNNKPNGKFLSKYGSEFDVKLEEIVSEYLNNIHVYITLINNDDLCTKVESKIQYELTEYFNIREYTATNGSKICQSGEQEIKDSKILNSLELTFSGELNGDADTQLFLENTFNFNDD